MENSAISSEEKRESPRVEKLFMIAYLPQEEDSSRTPISLGRTVDISPSGVGMEIYKEVALGTTMEMEIDLEGLPVSARGKVVRVDPLDNGNFLIGIRFDAEQELLLTKIALAQIASLQQRRVELEKVLTELVQTGWPWSEDGQPNELFHTAKVGFAPAMLAAKRLISSHPETPDEELLVSELESSDFSSWQGNRGIARRRTTVRRTSKAED